MVGLAKLSLANRMLAALLTVLVVVFGVIAMTSMRVELFPSLEAPGASVMATYPGASPEVMEREVVEPLETAVEDLADLEVVTSTSSTGSASVDIIFALDVDAEEAVDEARASVNEVQSEMPEDAEVTFFDWGGEDSSATVMALAASADEDESVLSDNINEQIVPELEGISGVREVQVAGEREEIIEIEPDEDELEDEGLTEADISGALQEAGLVLPGGALTNDERSLSVNVGDEFESVEDIEDVYVMPQAAPADPSALLGGGAAAEPEPVRLGDVADVGWAVQEAQSLSRANGDESISLVVNKERDANVVEVSNAVKEVLSDLEDELGEGGELSVTVDTAPFIEDSVEGLVEKGAIGLAIVVVLILAFLLSVRTTIVTVVSIPLSLLIALIALWQTEYTLNMLTLAGLTVAVGRVVDDSIVVLENIKRHLSYGGERVPGIITAVREVAGAVTSATLATAAVFLPIAFVGGMISIFFRPFGVTVAVALVASLVVSLTIIPVLAYWFVRSDVVAPEDRERIRHEKEAKERHSWLQRSYIPVLRAATKRGEHGWKTWRRWVVVAAGLAVLGGTFFMTGNLQFALLEDDKESQLRISQELPAGTSLQATNVQAEEVEAVLESVAEVQDYEATIGGSGDGFGSSGQNTASYWVTLDSEGDLEEARAALEERLGDLDEDAGELEVMGLMGGGGGGADPTADVTLLSSNTGALEEAAADVSDMMRDIDGINSVSSDLTEGEPGIEVTPKAEEAAENGLTETQISQAAQSAFDGMMVGSTLVGGAEHEVVISTGEAPQNLRELRNFEFAGPSGTVELGDVATIEEVERPTEILRSDGERSVTVTGEVDSDADLNSITMEVTDQLEDLELPAEVSTDLGGEAEELNEVMRDMGIALLTSIAIVFVIMVATFRSLAQPLILLVSIPFAATGALAALMLTGTTMSLPAMIGLLMLVGIVVTNAIVLIDLINQYRKEGMPLNEAVIEGGRQRLRPILMTALATMGALVPMAIGYGTGSVFIGQALAIVVIGGLVSSTILTLLILPALYMMLEEGKERRAARRAVRRARRAERRAARTAQPGWEEGDGPSSGGLSTGEPPAEPGPDLDPETPDR